MSDNLKIRLDAVALNNPELLLKLKNANVEDALAILINFAHARHIELGRDAALEWLSTHAEKAKELSLDKLEEVVGGGRGSAVSMKGATGTTRIKKYDADEGPQVF